MFARFVAWAAIALLAGCVLFAGTAHGQSPVLYDQYNNGIGTTPPGGYVPSVDECDLDSGFCNSYVAADDFVVPVGQTWSVDRIEVDGYFVQSDPPNMPDLWVFIFDDAPPGTPGSVPAER